ncbi:acyltransferase [Gordonia sp. PKS22-38]|uniref:Acyltransferase n=1 Tax=Gordonia prachuapensis TaxID=3115651 RepID=A0ABU7MWH0_9ACTN|nr:acyltransferase [Gordonia sp. PKS22-38]
MTAKAHRWPLFAGLSTRMNRMARATPQSRERVVDSARAVAIVVVVLWHWTLSVTHRAADESLTMPNPIDDVPWAWAATWVLQVMPMFFLVGGYANLTCWQRSRAEGVPSGRLIADRLRRLLIPTAVWAFLWLTYELVSAVAPGPHRWIWQWFPGYLVPVWFLIVYIPLIVTLPITAAWHNRHPVPVLAALAGLIALGSLLGRGLGMSWVEWLTAAVVWVFCHHLGYAWRTFQLGRRPLLQRSAIAGAGLTTLIALTVFAQYPHSMVATTDMESNIFPTNAAIAALAVFQLGLLAVITPPLARLLRRPQVWTCVVAVNAVALTVFLWHMTAYVVVVRIFEGTGHTLLTDPTAAWWAQRGLWLLAPLAVLLALIAALAPVESWSRKSRPTPDRNV